MRPLDAEEVAAVGLEGGPTVRTLMASHEALRAALANERLRADGLQTDLVVARAALATAETERDTAMESREWWRTARSDDISLDLKAAEARVAALTAFVRRVAEGNWNEEFGTPATAAVRFAARALLPKVTVGEMAPTDTFVGGDTLKVTPR